MKRVKQLLFLKQNSSFILPADEGSGEWRRPGVCGVLGGGAELVWAQGPGGALRLLWRSPGSRQHHPPCGCAPEGQGGGKRSLNTGPPPEHHSPSWHPQSLGSLNQPPLRLWTQVTDVSPEAATETSASRKPPACSSESTAWGTESGHSGPL